MKGQFSTEPQKWQTAYTADNAYYDAGAISSTASRVGAASLFIAFLYSIIFLFAQISVRQHLFDLDAGFIESLDKGQIIEPLREEFKRWGWILTGEAAVTVEKAGSEWLIQDKDMQYIIRHEGQELNVSGRKKGILFLLRNFYAKQYLSSLPPQFAEMLDARQVIEPLREVFQNIDRALTDEAVIVVKRDGSEWMILDVNKQYLVRKERGTLQAYETQKEPVIYGVWIITAILVYVAFKLVKKAAFRFTEAFFQEFYRPPLGINSKDIVNYRLGSRIKLPMPFSEWFPSISQFKYILVQNGDFLKKDDWPAWLARNIGGPILLIVFDGSALYLERGDRFSRIVGPGISFLERYETIKYAVDLRAKSKTDSVKVWTKDGIVVELKICIEYRIGDPQKISAAPQLLYPYDPEAVKKAIERYALRWTDPTKEPSEFTWEDAVWGQVTSIVPAYIGGRFLDDLLVADRKGGQILAPTATNEIFNALQARTNHFGVHVTDFQIISIVLPPEVNEHYVKYWEAERQSLAMIMDGKAKAFNIRVREKVRADAQHDLILAIADGLKKNDGGQIMEALLLSLSEVLDHGLSDPYMRSYTAKETLETLEKIQSMLGNNKPEKEP